LANGTTTHADYLRLRAEAYMDPYRPLPPAPTPATGSPDPAETELAPGEEPIATGTLFLSMVILMIIGAIWVVTYGFLLNR
jgi:hypothetical protein